MTSDLKSATSRANGAKSHGPKTPEGKEKSSQNSLDHGFTAKKTILLECENQGQFQEMVGYYNATYQPGSPVEEDLVSEMVACRWRMQRLRFIETALIDSEMDRELPEGETPEDPGYQLAFAWRRLVDESRAISLASRYESRLHRIHERTHRTLLELQQTRRRLPAEPLAPPEPTSTHPCDDKKSRNEPTPPASEAAADEIKGEHFTTGCILDLVSQTSARHTYVATKTKSGRRVRHLSALQAFWEAEGPREPKDRLRITLWHPLANVRGCG